MKFKIYGVAWLGNPSATPLVHVVADKTPKEYYQVTEAVEVELTMLSNADMVANRSFALEMAKVAANGDYLLEIARVTKLSKLQAELHKLQGE
jgi:hypothetical protein